MRDEDRGTIFLNELSTISPMAVLGHALIHLLRIESPAAYGAIAAVASKRVKSAQGFRKYYGAGATMAGDKVLEDLISELNGDLVSDGRFWREVFVQIEAEHGAEAKGVIAKLAAAI